MNKRYDKIMDSIKVTDEMRSRILQNVQRAEITPDRKSMVIRFSSVKKYIALAACFAVVLVGALTIPNLLTPKPPADLDGLTQNGDIVAVASAEELSAVVGFDVSDVSSIPFTVEETDYTAYWQELAEIKYTGVGQTMTYRKSTGTEDNSGDYNTYDVVADKELQGVTFELKGSGELYYLAVWNTNGYSYSLSFAEGIDETALSGLLENNIAP